MDDKHYRARITKRVDFAPDLWMIRIDPGAEFTFAPGQYATLGIERDARRLERPYSIASSPYEKELEFFFELVPQGETTPPLYDLQLGDEVLVRKVAKGLFTLDTAQPERTNHLLVSTVTGVAPFVSYVRTLFKDWKEGRFAGNHKLFLLNGASRSWEFGYREELEKFAKQAPWFRCVFTVSRPWEDESWKGEVGRVDELHSQVRRPVGMHRREYHRVSVRPSGDGRARQGHPEAHRLQERELKGRSVLGSLVGPT